MALQINTNMGALMASSAASSVNRAMETSMNRLSTGLRINAARDDAAGVAIASRLTAEIRGTNQAIRNASDGQALIDTAEGAHLEIVNILQRMRELSVQSANDTNGADDRTNLQAEVDALVEEIDRIAEVSTWAGQQLLKGSGGNNGDGTFVLQVGAGTSAADRITATITAMDSGSLGVSRTKAADIANLKFAAAAADGKLELSDLKKVVDANGDADFEAATKGDTVLGSKIAVTAVATKAIDFSLRIDGVDVTYTQATGGFGDTSAGVAQGLAQAIRDANIPGVSVMVDDDEIAIFKGSAGLVTDAAAARTMIGAVDQAILSVNTQRSELGAISNRLDSTISNLTNISTNLEAGRSSIQDADFAAESTALAKSQILQQAFTAMLAQANASKQGVLQLLQG